MKTILLLLFISCNVKGQSDSIIIRQTGWSTAMGVGSKKGIAIDSVGVNETWYKSNYRYIPEHGLFVDTVILKSKDQNYYITTFRVIVDRKMIVESEIFRYWADRKLPTDFRINKKYFQP